MSALPWSKSALCTIPDTYHHDIKRLSTPDRERQSVSPRGHCKIRGIEYSNIADLSQTTRRLGRFLGGPFAGENLSSALELERVHDEQHVWMRLWSAPPELKISFSEARSALSRSSQRYEKGTALGPSFTNHWVHVMLQIPQSFRVSSEPIICKYRPYPTAAMQFSPVLQSNSIPGAKLSSSIQKAKCFMVCRMQSPALIPRHHWWTQFE